MLSRKSKRRACECSKAATLIELLVVMYIVGLLIALLLPAVQAAREAGRQAACLNNLRQIGLGFALHEDAQRVLPSGGWGWQWQGDPDRGFGARQPGSWAYNVLPFLEQQELREMGQGQAPPVKSAAGRDMAAIPLGVFYCPTRRPPEAYPFVHPKQFVNIDPPTVLARSDYVANAGDQKPGLYGPGPNSLASGDSPFYVWPDEKFTGMVFRRSRLRVADARDGASHTYLVAEGYLSQDDYFTGQATNDDQGVYTGADRDTLRVAHLAYPPLPDLPSLQSDHSFGSAHASGFNAAFSDGAVRHIPYTIGAETHRRLANRKDRQPVDAAQF